MLHTIANDKITFVSDSYNIDPKILRFNDSDENYLAQDPPLSPPVTAICFPLLGTVPGGTYFVDGKEYAMGMHGFAHTSDFKAAEKDPRRIVYEITDDENTLKQFPYKFRLQVVYSVEGESLLTCYRVKNLDKKEMFFNVGGHPRYACPVGQGAAFEDYYLEFEKSESISNIVKSFGPLSIIEKFLSPDGRTLRLDYRMFEKGCFCFHPFNSGVIALKNIKNSRALTLKVKGVSHLQVWTKPDAPYLAIEPWYGSITSLPPKESEKDWKNRQGILRLQPGEEYSAAYDAVISR
jgi:galactose mutarotase-like enzyme